MGLRGGVALVTLVLGSILVVLVGCEIAVRLLEGEPLGQLALRPFGGAPIFAPLRPLAELVRPLTTSRDLDPAWIDVLPPPLPNRRAPDPDLLARRDEAIKIGVPEFELYKSWNRRFLEGDACDPWFAYLRRLPGPLLAFDPPEPTPHPPFRYLVDRTTPFGLVTNHFGWRGPDVQLDKPAGTIRLAFVGASTTVGLHHTPFSYPEYVVHWLNRWAEESGRAVRFDGINAGREAIRSSDTAAIVRQEVRPAEPDLVVYYEGANQFLYADTARTPGTNVPLPTPGDLRRRWMRLVAASADRSALVRRVDRLVSSFAMYGGGEPPKPSYTVPWPADLDEHAPDPTRPDLPLDLPAILQDLDSMRSGLADEGATFVLTSFVWFVWDGMRLEPRRDGMIWSYLNQHTWPYRYADIRRAADLENRVFARWAAAHDVAFIDLAAAMPPDASLFADAIHLRDAGMRVQAWLVTQGLLPIITAQLNAGVWPRPDRVPALVHPGIGPTSPFVLRCPVAQTGDGGS